MGQHKSHKCFLLSDIDQQMRKELKEQLDKLLQMKMKWELECHADHLSLQKETKEIENQSQQLKKEMDVIFEELQQCLKKRQEDLHEEIDKLSLERCNVISKLQDLKLQTESSITEFEDLNAMTTFELVNRKITSFDHASKEFNNFVQEFKFDSVKQLHEMKWMDYKKQLDSLKKDIEQFGKIESSSLLELSNEWLYEPNKFEISTDRNRVKLIKKDGKDYRFVFNNTKMERGEVVSHKNFGAYAKPWNSHKSYFVSASGHSWSMELSENYRTIGLSFSTGHELALEMNCKTKQLIIRKVGSKETFTFDNILLPVYPSVVLTNSNDTVSIVE
ncbi:hypothetical protein C9374_004865 [Naegleria lovaniensis]|uniref:Uncharacterized protein n=1 Tax=Naegleria lovaniensis TaxID=51637 RepID=A0AA88GQY1_NAELO|nr:uncharacterized protein C9374_004865 [Naegleria lovaniensis]KAG2382898.1 hypothetical protein C9374_004865 [Naegleria lovaniensis]